MRRNGRVYDDIYRPSSHRGNSEYRLLWQAVLFQALLDLRSSQKWLKNKTIAWFMDDSILPGSFLFICDALGYDKTLWQNKMTEVLNSKNIKLRKRSPEPPPKTRRAKRRFVHSSLVHDISAWDVNNSPQVIVTA